jgi:hypothetical protein
MIILLTKFKARSIVRNIRGNQPHRSNKMNLLELQRHVNEAIKQNVDRGWDNRNDLPVLVQVNRRTPTGRGKSRYIPLDQVYRGQQGVGGREFGLSLMVCEQDEISTRRVPLAQRGWERAMGMTGKSGSPAEREERHYVEERLGDGFTDEAEEERAAQESADEESIRLNS